VEVERKEKKLPSGAVLRFNLAKFEDGRDLYQAFAEETKAVRFNSTRETGEVWKDLAVIALSSKTIEAAIWKCFKRATYDTGTGEMKITTETFEPPEAREDYIPALLEIGKENLQPFMKSLYAEFGPLIGLPPSAPA
jgi:hypothetical protein